MIILLNKKSTLTILKIHNRKLEIYEILTLKRKYKFNTLTRLLDMVKAELGNTKFTVIHNGVKRKFKNIKKGIRFIKSNIYECHDIGKDINDISNEIKIIRESVRQIQEPVRQIQEPVRQIQEPAVFANIIIKKGFKIKDIK